MVCPKLKISMLILPTLFLTTQAVTVDTAIYFDTVSAEIYLNNGQTATIGLLDTSGDFIRYIRNGNPVNQRKTYIKLLRIDKDSIEFNTTRPIVNPDEISTTLPSSPPEHIPSPLRPQTISSEEYYKKSFPEVFGKYDTLALAGEGVNYLGIALQVCSPIIAPNNVWVGAGIGISGFGFSVLGSTIAVNNNLKALNLLYQARDCEEVNIYRYTRTKRAINVLYVLGGVFSFVGPSIALGSETKKTGSGTLTSTYSVSLLGLVFNAAAGIVQIVNIRKMRWKVKQMYRECGSDDS
jgi:hypothetical protein